MANGKKPEFRAYNVTSEGDDQNWTQIGAMWLHGDSDGYNLVLDAFPVNGKVVLRKNTAKPKPE